jgi:hypothetical protein
MCFLAQDYLVHAHNLSSNGQIGQKIPEQFSKRVTLDISHILMIYWFEPFLNFVGFIDYLRDALTLKILRNDLTSILHRSVV